MEAAAKKKQNVYAPSRVYSYSNAATAEKLNYGEEEYIPAQIPRTEPKRHAAPQTRIIREATPAAKRKQRLLPKLVSVVGVLTIAAIMIGLVFRYATIASAYKAINSTESSIKESQRRITELEVQLDEAVTLEEAKLAAAEAGLNYPTADQIVTVNGTVGKYMNDTATTETESETEPDGGTAGSES
jgi:cell division protein FtsL